MTQAYIKKRQQLKEQAGDKEKKEVDRRASKNRKIRYVVHDTIANFMTPLENLVRFEGRDAIVNNMFGVGQKHTAKRVANDVQLI